MGCMGKTTMKEILKGLAEENGRGAKCCNCGGENEAQSLEFPSRVKETEVAKIRAVECLLCRGYQKGVVRVSIFEGPAVVKTGMPTLEPAPQPENPQQDPEILHVKKVDFVLFLQLNYFWD